jgi:hypothetical protein
MFSMPIEAISKGIRAMVGRTHNMPEDMASAEMEAYLERQWQLVMGKAETYARGGEILDRGGFFNTLSLGNWMVLCAAADVEMVPSRYVGSVNPVMMLDMATNGMSDRWMDDLRTLIGGIQDLADDEILRLDDRANSALKTAMAMGQAGGACPAPGWERKEGVIFPDLQDQRLVEGALESPENERPVWARKWIEAATISGDAVAGYNFAVQPQDRLAGKDLEAARAAAGDAVQRYACEWRVYVLNGKVQGIANYYPQITRGATPEDRDIALDMAAQARSSAERILVLLRDVGATPHHPKYELREGFDPDGVHFSLDFIEVLDADAPHGRRLIMLEGGPAHLRNPNWGAHPTSFGVKRMPEGLALGPGSVEPLDVLDGRAR